MSDFSQSNSLLNKVPKTKQQYSRNIKKLKLKLSNIEQQIEQIQKKLKSFSNTSNDKMIAMKISKFCKQRRMTPQMIYRCADKYKNKKISKSIFKQTLINLGLKLTQHQMTRLEYLLDQDISGQISQQEYNQFLIAYRIKGQFSTQDILLKNMLNKLDLITKKDQQNKQQEQQQNRKKYKQLLDYQQFLKYCKRHYPILKDKQIMAIFKKLAKNDKIDMDQFYRYIKKKKQDLKRIQQKNKKKQIKKQISTDIDKNSLKGLIMIILKTRSKDAKPIFHAIQFANAAKYLQKSKGQLLQIFRQIDKQKKGSFGFNQIIAYYIDKQKSKDLLFTYELMGRKMYLDKQMPQDVINRYNDSAKDISLADFQRFMIKQFNINDKDAQALFRALTKQNTISVQAIINAMKVEQGQRKMVYAKPITTKVPNHDFWKKSMTTILFNPFVALRFCLQIQDQLKKSKVAYWDDYQFGPSNQNQFGELSIDLSNIARQSVKWFTVQQLGMEQFYENKSQVEIPVTCIHDIFPKTLCQLLKMKQVNLWSSDKFNPNVRKISEKDLYPLFQGMYPQIFHTFKRIGLYVFKFYSHQKWAYVLVDSKIPCTLDKQPLFTYSKGKKYSWVSLIQKAYAKLKGSYKKMFNVWSTSQYVHQLSRKLPLSVQISRNLLAIQAITDGTKQAVLLKQKNKIWQQIMQKYNQQKQQKIYALASTSTSQQIIINKIETGLLKNIFYQVLFVTQIKDEDTKNKHKSHRLIFVKNKSINDKVWNPNWNSGQDQNKFDKFYSELEDQIRKKKIQSNLLKLQDVNIINFKLFRSIFDQIYSFKKHSFQNMIILRKIVEFEKNFECLYQLNSKMQNKQPLKLIVTLNKIRGPSDTIIQLNKNITKNNESTKYTLIKNFGAFEFTVGSQLQQLHIKITKWQQNQDYIYVLTFYIENALYHLRELDRQELFEFVGPSDEMYPLDISNAEQKQRVYLQTNYFKAADRGTGCCG